ncbi:MAG: DUF4160 domain-containing protein [Planctomycetota bacterium]
MPVVSRFFGISIALYHNDHWPPHFHARHGEFEASLLLDTLEVCEGRLPRSALSRARKWGRLHREEIERDWELARLGLPLNAIPPLE